MKRIIYLILGVLLFLPALVKADSSGPGIIPFKATPKSPSGADIYEWNDQKESYVKTGKKLEYGKVITITWEEEYVPVDEDDEENEDVVKFSDLVLAEKNYKVDEKNLDDPFEVLILKKLDIKKGPANVYESTGKTIPADAKIKIRYLQYYDEESKEYVLEDTAWAYVEYNGTKGFIDTEDSIAFDGTYTTIICSRETEIYNVGYTKILGTIKPYTKFNAMVYKRDHWAGGYYIEFGSIKGIIYDGSLIKRQAVTLKPTRNIKVYKDLKEDEDSDKIISEVVTTIKSGTSFSTNYYNVDNSCATIYYEKNSTKGWIRECDWDYNDENDDSDEEYIYIENVLGYTKSDYFGDIVDNPVIAVTKGANDAKSSAVNIFKTPKDIDDEEEEEEEETPEGETSTDPEQGGSSVAPDQPKTETKTKKKVPELVYYCLGAAVVVSITAVVTILLVNKKKKTVNNEEKNEEVKKEEK